MKEIEFIKTPLLINHNQSYSSQYNQSEQSQKQSLKLSTSSKVSLSSSDFLLDFHSKPIDIIFKDIHYHIYTKQYIFQKENQKYILNGVTGIFKSGKINVIMGSSGSGKTTLLNIISCKIKNNIRGSIFINDQNYNQTNIYNFASYVMQNDILFQTLTVFQTLQFVADLKMKYLNQKQKKRKINNLIKQMKLQKTLNTLIGSQFMKGISGGQKKRVSIAIQLISNPKVLILDQPTSGLDSLTAFIIISYLNKLAKIQQRTIIMTVHQPSYQIYQLFDRIILMSQGKLIYQGFKNKIIPYFQGIGYKFPQNQNPIDFIISFINKKQDLQDLLLSYDSKIAQQVNLQIQNRQKQKICINDQNYFQKSMLKVLRILLKRDIVNILRNPILLNARILQTVLVCLFVGGVFFKTNPLTNGQQATLMSLRSLLGSLFFISINSLMMSLLPVSLTFPIQRQVFIKQRNSNLYSTIAYFISRNVIQLPYLMVLPLLGSLILYQMIGLSNTFNQFAIFWLINVGLYFVGASFGMLIGSLFKDPTLAAAVSPAFMIPFIVFAGFFKNVESFPTWIGWIQYISPVRYAFVGLVKNEFNYQKYDQILDIVGFGSLSILQSVTLLFVFAFFIRILSLLCLIMTKNSL